MTFLDMVGRELFRARSLHPQPYHSHHEALGVLWEEFTELRDEVFRRTHTQADLLAELVQVAAVAQRWAEDRGLVEGGR